MIYIIFFSVSTLCIASAEQIRNRSKVLSYGLVVAAIISLSILNGVRDYSIGTDIMVYGNKVFELAVYSNNYREFLDSTYSVYLLNIEYGYQAFNFIFSRLTNNVHWFYFYLGILTNSLFYYGISLYRGDISIPISWLVYLFLFYGNTLNIMRQSVALGLIFISISIYLKKDSILLSILLIIIGILFHQSAIIGIIILILCHYLKKSDNSIKVHMKIIGVSLLISFLSAQILSFMGNIGLLNNKFEQYIDFNKRESKISLSSIGMRVPFVSYWIIFYKRVVQQNLLMSFMFLLTVIDFILLPLREVDITVSRITLYVSVFKIISYPIIVKNTTRRYLKITIFFLMIIFLLTIWYLQFVVSGNGEIYPFNSKILDEFFGN